MITIEPTSRDIGRYIEERLKEDLGTSVMDKKLRVGIRRIVLKGDHRNVGISTFCWNSIAWANRNP